MTLITIIGDLLSDARNGYRDAFSRSDTRTDGLPLVGSPWLPISICCCYYLICVNARKFSPKRPYELKYTMAAYNLLMVFVSGWMFYMFAVDGWLGPYLRNARCPPYYPNRALAYTPEQDRRIVIASMMYYYTKYVEFLDTLFFMLRHKFHQMSYLHMIHHGLMPWGIYYQVKWFPTGAGTFIAFLNSGVHTVMYLYYGLAALGLQPYMNSWKKYMTRMQMAQFVAIFFYYLDLWLVESNFFGCHKVPTVICFLASFSATMVFILFANFYITAYLAKRRRERKKRESSQYDVTEFHKNNNNGGHTTNGLAANGSGAVVGNGRRRARSRSPSPVRPKFPVLCR